LKIVKPFWEYIQRKLQSVSQIR